MVALMSIYSYRVVGSIIVYLFFNQWQQIGQAIVHFSLARKMLLKLDHQDGSLLVESAK